LRSSDSFTTSSTSWREPLPPLLTYSPARAPRFGGPQPQDPLQGIAVRERQAHVPKASAPLAPARRRKRALAVFELGCPASGSTQATPTKARNGFIRRACTHDRLVHDTRTDSPNVSESVPFSDASRRPNARRLGFTVVDNTLIDVIDCLPALPAKMSFAVDCERVMRGISPATDPSTAVGETCRHDPSIFTNSLPVVGNRSNAIANVACVATPSSPSSTLVKILPVPAPPPLTLHPTPSALWL